MKITRNIISANNFTVGRKGWEVDTIVIHVEEGTEEATDSWFNTEASDVSATYGVDKKGNIEQFVEESNSAWAQGRVYNPTAKVVLARPNVNPNYYCISIEHEGDGKSDLTPPQRIASAWLITDIMSRHPKIQFNRDHIIGHREIYAKKTCPGKIDINKIIEVSAGILSIPKMLTPKIVYSGHFKDYLIVTQYISDTEWYFVPFQQLTKQAGIKAQTPLSQMPNVPING